MQLLSLKQISHYLRFMIAPGPGVLLIAEPFLKDPHFRRTVVLLCDHKEEGSFGFILNRRDEPKLNEVVEGIESRDWPIYYGGPVREDTLHFIHRYPEQIPGGEEILPGVFWGGEFERVPELIREGAISGKGIRFFRGYSGWSEGQLAFELNEKSWLTVMANRNIIFTAEGEALWKEALHLLGGEYDQLANYPIDPQLN